MSYDSYKQIINLLKDSVKKRGLKYTKQREIVLEVLLKAKEHLNAEEIHKQITNQYPNEKIGIATVYRALAFLEEVNLVLSISFNKEGKKYEINYKTHHDHLICVKCGKIIEFTNEQIEQAQEKIAQDNGFELINHTMYLYGICSDCK